MKKIQTVLFDLDGTLINSAPDLAAAVNATMLELGRSEYPLEQVIQWVGNGSKVLLKRALTGDFNGEPSSVELAQALPLFLKNYQDNLSTESEIYDGVFPALLELQKAGIKMACVTNKPIEFTHPVLAAFSLDQFMPVVVGGGSLPQLKPSPEPLLHACELLGVDLAMVQDKVLMVGDSSSDIKAAKAAGIQSVAVDYGYSQGVDLIDLGANKIISNMQELVVLLGTSDGFNISY